MPARASTSAAAVPAATAAPRVFLFGPAVDLTVIAGGLMVQGSGGAASEPVLVAWTNEHVGAAGRATVLSVRSTFFTLGGAAGLLVLGLVGRLKGIAAAWTVSATILALAAPGYLALGRVATVPAPDLGVELPMPPSKASGTAA